MRRQRLRENREDRSLERLRLAQGHIAVKL